MIIHNLNKELPDSLKKELHDTIIVDEYLYPGRNSKNPIYSSFRDSNGPHFPEGVERYYHDLIAGVLHRLGLKERASVYSTKWCQVYNNSMGGGHPPHSHYGGSELFSWVHFVETPADQKCFYFLDTDHNKYYPDTQNSGDLIIFPSWAMHGVDKVEIGGVNRTVVSGNIICNKYKESDNDPMLLVCSPKMVQGEPILVWAMVPNQEDMVPNQEDMVPNPEDAEDWLSEQVL